MKTNVLFCLFVISTRFINLKIQTFSSFWLKYFYKNILLLCNFWLHSSTILKSFLLLILKCPLKVNNEVYVCSLVCLNHYELNRFLNTFDTQIVLCLTSKLFFNLAFKLLHTKLNCFPFFLAWQNESRLIRYTFYCRFRLNISSHSSNSF